jgi:hypothetical protein
MSSHHFVREGQEPALLILDDSFDEMLKDLLEWAPFIAVASQVVGSLLAEGTKVDLVIAVDDAEKRLLEGELEHQAPVEVVVRGTGRSYLDVGLAALIGKGQSAVNVIAIPEPALFGECQQFAGRMAISLLSRGEKWALIERGIFEKWYPTQTVLAVRPTFPGQMIDYQGLIRAENEFRVMDSRRVRISSDRFFWVCEPY